MVTGTLFFRESIQKPPDPEKKIMLVMGVLSVPENFEPKPEHQYAIVGEEDGSNIQVLLQTGKDLEDKVAHCDADQVFLQPIWRV